MEFCLDERAMEYDIPFRSRTALIAAQPSRCLLHLVIRTLEAVPNLALIEL
jgi:hypothetical protein